MEKTKKTHKKNASRTDGRRGAYKIQNMFSDVRHRRLLFFFFYIVVERKYIIETKETFKLRTAHAKMLT